MFRNRVVKGLLAGSLGLGLGLAWSFRQRTAGPAGPESETWVSPAYKELQATLQELERTWHPRAKSKLLIKVREQTHRFKPPLLWILARPEHPLLEQAIALAAELDLQDARPYIARLVRSGPVHAQPGALVASHQLEPWTKSELAEFLTSGTAAFLEAALEVASTLQERPLAEIFVLLGHPEQAVQEAALLAIPEELPAKQLRELLEIADADSGEAGAFALAALGKVKSVRGSELDLVSPFLLQKLQRQERAIRVAALQALTARGLPLAQPGAVWARSMDYEADLSERAWAFLCLERTSSYSTSEILLEERSLHPYLRFFAARCLITAGRKEGVAILLSILYTADEETGQAMDSTVDSTVKAIVPATMSLLASLSRTGLYAGKEAWQIWYEGLHQPSPQNLPPPAMELLDLLDL